MLLRNITPTLLAALRDTPVVVLHGARRTGKSTLAQWLAADKHPARYITLDEAGVLAVAKKDPQGFLAAIDGPVVLDEIQRAPELFLAIKSRVDRERKPGRFLLTGSAHVLQLPRLADSLAGRMEILTLWPLSQGELAGVREGFIDALFGESLPPMDAAPVRQAGRTRGSRTLMDRAMAGGYPEALARRGRDRRRAWFESYLGTILLRDVRDMADISGLADLPRLLAVVAGRAGGLLSYADLGRDVGLNQVTLKRYFGLLAATFLVRTVRPWFTSRVKRLMKSEKVYLGDTGLLAHLLDFPGSRRAKPPHAWEPVLENLVAVELLKQSQWSRTRPEVLHFRDYQGVETDFVLEAPGGRRLVGVEVKATASLGAEDFRGLRALAEAAGERFHRGIVLYTGSTVVPAGPRLHALPVEALWQLGATNVKA